MSADVGWTMLAAVVMIVGLAGVVVPILPGLLLIWLAALGYGFAVGFGPIGVVVMAVLTALVLVSLVLGVVLPKREASGSGASKLAQLGGLAGAIVGFFIIPVVGIVVGALIGVIVVELASKGNWPEAWSATKAVARGFGKSALADLGIGMTMIAFWSIWAVTVVI
jgi:uncharacterized protein YqgC (DUF456 family)